MYCLTEKLVKILADNYRVIKEQLHKYGSRALLVCFENHVGTLSGGNSLIPVGGGAKPPKFPTNPPPHLHSKRLFLALF
jgi:hypothetical protein